jgi:hypothetical protein
MAIDSNIVERPNRADQPIKPIARWGRLVTETHTIKSAGDPMNGSAHVRCRCINLAEETNLSQPASAIATVFFSFATSILTNASL